MTSKLALRAALTLTGALAIAAGCAPKPLEGTQTQKVYETADGTAIVDTMSVDATVTQIDLPTRAVTLKGKDGGESTFTAGKHVDLDRLKVGDSVHATITEALAVYLSKSGAPISIGEATGAAMTTTSDGREVIVATTMKLTARVTAVDATDRKVTLKFADGSSKTVKVGKKVDLGNVKVGDDVVAKLGQGVTIAVTSTPAAK